MSRSGAAKRTWAADRASGERGASSSTTWRPDEPPPSRGLDSRRPDAAGDRRARLHDRSGEPAGSSRASSSLAVPVASQGSIRRDCRGSTCAAERRADASSMRAWRSRSRAGCVYAEGPRAPLAPEARRSHARLRHHIQITSPAIAAPRNQRRYENVRSPSSSSSPTRLQNSSPQR